METGNVENMSLSMAFAFLVNSSLWIAYAFTSKPYDLYIAVSPSLALLPILGTYPSTGQSLARTAP
jgi:hypothetical protein